MKNNVLKLILVCGVAVSVSACMYEPDHFSTSKLQVEQQDFSQTLSASDVNDALAYQIARDYTKYGDGPFNLTVAYDPAVPSSAMHASDEAARIGGLLRKNGLSNIQTSLLPVNGTGAQPKVLIDYTAYNALAPKDCTLMPGINTRTIETEEEYKLGCTVDTLYARQIARPKDLNGQAADGSASDGRRAANIVDVYRTGQPNESLGGEQASGDN